MKRKSVLFRMMALALCLVFVLGMTSCATKPKTPETRTILNADGSEVVVPMEVNRIGCLFGPSYEKVVLLGAEDKIVFDGDFHIYSWPWSNVVYKKLNDVPGIPNAHSAPNIEDLVSYGPDIVFNFPNSETTAAMEAAGIAVVPMAGTTGYDSIVKEIRAYADAIGGDCVKVAERYSEYFYGMVERIENGLKAVDQADYPSVYYANEQILITHGNGSFIPDVIRACGGVPVSGELVGGNKTQITAEQFVEWDPDFIFVDHAGSSGNASAEEVIDEMLASGNYSGMTAVKNDAVYVVPTGVFFWDSGTQLPLLMLYLASTLHPEAFPDVDMAAELKAFYAEFFYYNLTDEQAESILAHLDPA